MMRLSVVFCLALGALLSAATAKGQELNCTVKVLAPNLQATDPRVFETLEQSISEFLNNRRWTNDNFLAKERIDCSMLISITQEISSDRFAAQVTVQSSRPVFYSSYNTPLLYLVDKDLQFQYAQYQPLEYQENQFSSALVSFLAYYAYLIIGMDYDSFSPKGGNPYFQRASNIVSMAQSANAAGPGWKSFEGTRNRFWLINNLTNPKLDYIHDMLYKYHRQGLDQMYEQMDNGRKAVLEALTQFAKIRDDEPTAMFTQIFCQTKGEELINIFSKAPPQDKNQAVQILVSLDPSNAGRYQQILKSN